MENNIRQTRKKTTKKRNIFENVRELKITLTNTPITIFRSNQQSRHGAINAIAD